MLMVLKPTYTMRVTIKGDIQGIDKSDWNYLQGKTGCDEMIAKVKKALSDGGLAGADVFFEKFEHTT